MTLRKSAKRAKRRWGFLALAVGASVLLIVSLASAGAVGLANGFEDDDGNLVNDAAIAGIDWNSFAPTTWTGTAPYRQSSKVASGFSFRGIEDAQATTTDTAFAGGTKQDDNCPSIGTGKAPNKDDLKRIYLATNVVAGKTYLDLAWVRIPQNTTSPSAHIGFEFNKGTDGPCPAGSDGLVKRVAGDMLIVYDFEGGATDTPIISLRRWTTSGACEVSSNSAPCWGTASNLTALGYAEAKVNTAAPASDGIAPSPPDNLGINEFGEAGINLTDAQVFSAGTCESFGTAFGVSRSSGNSGTAQMKDLVGPASFTLANCGTVIIHKETSPDENPNTTDFTYTTNVTTSPATTTSPFTLKDDGTKTIANVVAGSSKNVTEADPGPNYSLSSIDCSASTVPAANYSTSTTTRAVTFSIAAGETLECTFTNQLQKGALRINKNSSKTSARVTNAGTVFTITPPVGSASDVTDDTTAAAPDEDADKGEVCVTGLDAGAYTVSEKTAPSGYSRDSATAQNYTVVAGSTCANASVVTFTDTPLGDLTVTWTDGGSGETKTQISCDKGTVDPADATPEAFDDTSEIYKNIAGGTTASPNVVTCTIKVDP